MLGFGDRSGLATRGRVLACHNDGRGKIFIEGVFSCRMAQEQLISSGRSRRFRSKGEAQIARLLECVGVSYHYEYPLAVVDRGKVRIWYPDFQLPRYGIIVEYAGLTDNPAYMAGIGHKGIVYEENGLTALILTPQALRGNWPERVLGQVEQVLACRLVEYRRARARLRGQRGARRTVCATRESGVNTWRGAARGAGAKSVGPLQSGGKSL